jgi:hypothetical protein
MRLVFLCNVGNWHALAVVNFSFMLLKQMNFSSSIFKLLSIIKAQALFGEQRMNLFEK